MIQVLVHFIKAKEEHKKDFSNALPNCLKQTFCIIGANKTQELDKLLASFQGIQKICDKTPQVSSCKAMHNMQELVKSYHFGLNNVTSSSECREKYKCRFPAKKFKVSTVTKRVSCLSIGFFGPLPSLKLILISINPCRPHKLSVTQKRA